MIKNKGKLNICSRGHKFYKNSDCPVCPICWSGYYKDKMNLEFPKELAAPALRALLNSNITTLTKLATYTESQILKLHGIGPSSIPMLNKALKQKGLTFSKQVKSVGAKYWKKQLNISTDKYTLIAKAILKVLTVKPIRFTELVQKVKTEVVGFKGSVEWYSITTLRQLEKEGKVVRNKGSVVTYYKNKLS